MTVVLISYLWCLTRLRDSISDPGNEFAWVFQIVDIFVLISKETHSIKISFIEDICVYKFNCVCFGLVCVCFMLCAFLGGILYIWWGTVQKLQNIFSRLVKLEVYREVL